MTTVTTMRGRQIDIEKFMKQNENTVAIGNLNMNARGDILGTGGRVVKRKEEIVSEYYLGNPKSVKQVSLREITPDVFESPAAAVADVMKRKEPDKAEKPHKTRKLIDSED